MNPGQQQGPADVPTGKRMEHIVSAVALGMKLEAQGKHETNEAANERASETEVESLIANWPKAPQMSARMMMERYGPPNEATHARLIWHNPGAYKRATLTRDVYTHHFPMPHTDFLSLTIDYNVPLDKVADALRLDGSIIIDRTAGEVTARCDSEAADLITLNLLHEVVTGTKSVDDARRIFAEQAPAYVMGKPAPYAEKLNFQPPREKTEFMDETLVAKAQVEKVKEKAKEMMGAG